MYLKLISVAFTNGGLFERATISSTKFVFSKDYSYVSTLSFMIKSEIFFFWLDFLNVYVLFAKILSLFTYFTWTIYNPVLGLHRLYSNSDIFFLDYVF